MALKGNLHLLERLNHVFRLNDGSGHWASGYWQLDEIERMNARKLYLHKTKSKRSFWGGDIVKVVPAIEYAVMARQHNTDPEERWVLIVMPSPEYRDAVWEGKAHLMAYKSLV